MAYWVFDYDNTLYHPNSGILDAIDERIEKYISATLKVSTEKALELREKYYRYYGTTIQGLMELHSVDPQEYFAYIMDIEKVPEFCEETKQLIESLPGEKAIFSNGNKHHIYRGLDSLGIRDCFSKVFDIEDFQYISKPNKLPYLYVENSLKRSDLIFIDDSLENIETAIHLGWKGILINRYNVEVPENIPVIDNLLELKDLEIA